MDMLSAVLAMYSIYTAALFFIRSNNLIKNNMLRQALIPGSLAKGSWIATRLFHIKY